MTDDEKEYDDFLDAAYTKEVNRLETRIRKLEAENRKLKTRLKTVQKLAENEESEVVRRILTEGL